MSKKSKNIWTGARRVGEIHLKPFDSHVFFLWQDKTSQTAFLSFSFCCLPVNFYSLEMPIFHMLFNVVRLFEKKQSKRTTDAEDLTHSSLLCSPPPQQVLFLPNLVRNKSRLIQLQNLDPCQVKYFSKAYPALGHTV